MKLPESISFNHSNEGMKFKDKLNMKSAKSVQRNIIETLMILYFENKIVFNIKK